MISLLLSLALYPMTCGSAPVAPQPSAEVQAQVELYLSTIDTRIPAARWKALGEPGVIALAQIARSRTALPTGRARAVAGAGVIGGARAQALALELTQPDAAPPVVRQSAARALGQLLSPAELTRALTPVLHSDPSLGVRAAAATVLSVKARSSSCAAVRAQSGREPPTHRAAFASALKTCEAAR